MNGKEKGRAAAPIITKISLAGIFLLGLIFIFLGIRGQRQLEDASLGSEDSYHAIYLLSGDLSAIWDRTLSKDLAGFEGEERATLDASARALVKESLAGSGGAPEDAAALEEQAGADSAAAWKLLYLNGLINGPKVTAAVRKGIAAMPEADRAALRHQLLTVIADVTAAAPEAAGGLLDGLEGTERRAMAMQLIIQASGGAEEDVTEHVKQLKKSVRDKNSRLKAYGMSVGG